MKPFDLERAKAGDPIGWENSTDCEVEFLRGDMGGQNPILVRFRYRGASEWATMHLPADTQELCMLPKKRTVYVNFYKHASASYWPSEMQARTAAAPASLMPIAIAVPVEVEE